MTGATIQLREARHEDYEQIAAFTQNTWPDREGGDYIPDIYHDWIDGDDRRTVVADAGDDIAGIVQCVLLSDWESWGQGMRVNPEFRGRGVASRMTEDLFSWAREQGATVMRNMVFSWNVPGLGQSRATGYDPATEFRWALPDPDPDADPDAEITADPEAAWRFWTGGDARDHLRGLALDDEETWAVSQLTRDHLRAAADDGGLFVVQDDGTRGFTHRVREYERPAEDAAVDSDETDRWVEYGVGAWEDAASADALFDAVARDAADRGADRVRMLIPETVRAVSDAALCRVEVSDEPDFVLAADLTR
ncbi:GNAT family N-acetyltransferase [Halorussus sp. MSC15.2]|uniref:GNAT family N-acetyltransferase n=1 Tax=Halorussus sp. MSC15.2 TaxID=2283638 RepID=UPI0013D03627|nr:GNAT family N-acetyltransferase [Halorussus sp. MSC15.2]NEU55775.1 GNAT family N-acetyltransferase [Halorussus sp. MSC15.2]